MESRHRNPSVSSIHTNNSKTRNCNTNGYDNDDDRTEGTQPIRQRNVGEEEGSDDDGEDDDNVEESECESGNEETKEEGQEEQATPEPDTRKRRLQAITETSERASKRRKAPQSQFGAKTNGVK
jgi:hypothetical protein